jgi:hypothetical protein
MRLETAMLVILPLFASCQDATAIKASGQTQQEIETNSNPYKTISGIQELLLIPVPLQRGCAAFH